jgi:hypothetical protein
MALIKHGTYYYKITQLNISAFAGFTQLQQAMSSVGSSSRFNIVKQIWKHRYVGTKLLSLHNVSDIYNFYSRWRNENVRV